MTAPMTPERKAEIRADDAQYGPNADFETMPYVSAIAKLRRELLAEVDRLEAEAAMLRHRCRLEGHVTEGLEEELVELKANHDDACRAFAVRVLREWDDMLPGQGLLQFIEQIESGAWPPKSEDT